MLSKMFGGSKKDSKKKKKKKKAKNMICPYFKVGLCQKGAKCKFSHDLEKESKSGKINLYHDPRAMQKMAEMEGKKPLSKEDDKFELWDTEKLHDVIAKNQK